MMECEYFLALSKKNIYHYIYPGYWLQQNVMYRRIVNLFYLLIINFHNQSYKYIIYKNGFINSIMRKSINYIKIIK
jgi:hypothetical protein